MRVCCVCMCVCVDVCPVCVRVFNRCCVCGAGLRGRGSVLDFWELDSSIPLRQSSPPQPPAASGPSTHHNPPSHPGSTNPRMTLSMTWPSTQLFQDYANDPPPPSDPILRNSGSGRDCLGTIHTLPAFPRAPCYWTQMDSTRVPCWNMGTMGCMDAIYGHAGRVVVLPFGRRS